MITRNETLQRRDGLDSDGASEIWRVIRAKYRRSKTAS
jgi:hypothetical protein